MLLKQWDDLPENWGQPDAPANPQYATNPEINQLVTPWPEGTATGWQYGPPVNGQRGPVLSAEEAENQQPSRQPQGALSSALGQHRSLGGMSEPHHPPNMQHPGLTGGHQTPQQQDLMRYNHKPNSLPYHPLPSFKQTRPELHAHDHPDHHEQPRSRFAPTPLPPYQTRSGGVRGVHPDAGGVDWENEL